MNISRRSVAMAAAGTLLGSTFKSHCNADDDAAAEEDIFTGIWTAHYRQTFLYLIIQPDRKAVFALLDQGYSFSYRTWFPAENGIIVGGFPMLRLWKSNLADRAKVRMQSVPPEATNDTFVRFPLSFYMKRRMRQPPPEKLSDLQLPSDWLAADPPADFDSMVGKPRTLGPN